MQMEWKQTELRSIEKNGNSSPRYIIIESSISFIYLRIVLEVNEAKGRDKIGLTYNNEEVVG